MRMTLDSTPDFYLTEDGFPVRAWTGTTESGVKVRAFISAIAAEEGQDHSALQAELKSIPGPIITAVEYRDGFTCPNCGMTSTNPHDVVHNYCGACKMFFEEVGRAERQE